jgi:hypothetical protein
MGLLIRGNFIENNVNLNKAQNVHEKTSRTQFCSLENSVKGNIGVQALISPSADVTFYDFLSPVNRAVLKPNVWVKMMSLRISLSTYSPSLGSIPR